MAAPTITSAATFTVDENTTAVGTLTATGDPTIVWSISGGADQARFLINSVTGAIGFAAAPDHDLPADADADNVYAVQVTATNGEGADSQTLAVTVNAAAETLPDKLEQSILNNPDPSVQRHERKDRVTHRHSPKELLEAAGLAAAREARRQGGMMRGTRFGPPRT